jgi:murein DD-endopeptidase MepM/ murein hydrolase activator NlpD
MDDRNATEVLVAREIVTTLAGPYADPDTDAVRRIRARMERRAERARPRRTWLWGMAVPAAAAAMVAAVALTSTALVPRATTPPSAEPPAVQPSESVSTSAEYQLPLRDPYEVAATFAMMQGGSMHFGVDLACPEGTPFYSVHSGTVTVAGDYGGYGSAVMVDDGGGVVVVYGHASSLAVTAGASVAAGDLLGYVGHSGYAVGDHLHLEVLADGGEYDPVRFLRDRGVELMPNATQ